MIDILLSTYNGEKYLYAQIVSIQKQTMQNWRLLVRDDGSTDNTIDILVPIWYYIYVRRERYG